MPERWERELDELRHIEMREPAVRDRIERGPSGDRRPSRKNALLAGVVAGAVVVAGIAALWQLDRNPGGSGHEPVDQPAPQPGVPGVVTVDIRRSSEETGDPEAIARFGAQERWMCPDGFSLVNPDGTTDEIMFDCGQSDVFQAPVGTPIEVTGDFATVDISTRLSGDGSIGAPTDRVADLDAGTVVTYAYEVTWDDGSEASFWLLLTVQDEEPTSEDPGIVVWIYGLGERSTDVPIITMSYGGETKPGCTEAFDWTLPDGTRVHEDAGGDGSLPPCSTDPLFQVPPGIPITVEVPTAIDVFLTRTTTPLSAGPDAFGASVTWVGGKGDFSVAFDVDVSDTPEEIELDCATGDRIAFAPPKGARVLPGGSAYVRGNILGVLPHDVVEQMTHIPDGESEWDGVWQIVRDGSVVATIDFPGLGGVACRGSGIQEI